ncbi:MAG: M61 family metallopeptidase [Oscillatoriales cyanobacterium RM2_1_1]|nr:M61 family metallopeptidase [Oscillatoriales cyanobacterium SM2_3_0]NJO46437.1 M61 family metallopeptidase [Oscillatoriales cyanobacterium RM2_1_1]
MTEILPSPLPLTSAFPPGSTTTIGLYYQVAMPQPENHLFEVRLAVDLSVLFQVEDPPSSLDLKMPVWTPGSYLVREYSRHLQDFQAEDSQGRSLLWHKQTKNHWRVQLQGSTQVVITYRVFANDLTVRTNHLDETHGYFNGAALFFYIPGYESVPHQVQLILPQDWQVATSLTTVPQQPNIFQAKNFDSLVDSPFEIGNHQVYPFQVQDKPHEWVIWGKGNVDPARMIADTQKMIAVEAELFGGLPYDRYLFILHLSSQGFGGLEHKDCCTLNYPRFGFQAKDKYNRFLQLVAHEFFHLWNVKRIRPKALEQFDYDQENYTPSLWFCEGVTSYYDGVVPFRAGLWDLKTYLNNIASNITRLQTIPGRKLQSLSQSSWDAWIKLYRRDAHSDNTQVSYYLKGELVAWLLDLQIRADHDNQRSLDDVMRQIWQRFGRSETGYTPEDLQAVIEAIAGRDLQEFFQRYIEGTEELPYDQYLEPFGLRIKAELSQNLPCLGLKVITEAGQNIIKFVIAEGPAQRAGLDANDELLAFNGFRVNSEQLNERLQDFRPGDTVELTVFHQDELRTRQVTLAPPQPRSYQIVALANPTAVQQRNFTGWLGCPYQQV